VRHLLLLACAAACARPAGECEPTCEAGSRCVAGACLTICAGSSDCSEPGTLCEKGVCVPADGRCAEDADCAAPGSCEDAAGARCVEGECRYEPLPCTAPPPPECRDGDTALRSFGRAGTCAAASGACTYEAFDFGCPDCAADCLPRCNALDCIDADGGCRVNGRCDPTEPARCVHDVQPDGTPCARPGGAGVCVVGRCLEPGSGACSTNGECSAACIFGACRSPSKLGFPCDGEEDADCATGLICRNSTCFRSLGATCASNRDCADACIAGACAARAEPGGACDPADDADCASGLVCAAQVCERIDGAACGTNDECAGTCRGGTCAPPAALEESCDAGDDADCGEGVCAAGTCKKADGASCIADSECRASCIDAECSARAEAGGHCDSTADCGPDLHGVVCASDGVCRVGDGASCADNRECQTTCREGTCGPRAARGDTCDLEDDSDCIAGLVCFDARCEQLCAQDSECASGNCECASADCGVDRGPDAPLPIKLCAPQDCVCTVWNGSSCFGDIVTGTDDPEDCEGDGFSCAGGRCISICTRNADCVSGNCECTDSECITRTCATANCVCTTWNGSACADTMPDNVTDPEDCDGPTTYNPDRYCLAGTCVNSCNGDYDCPGTNCECTEPNCVWSTCVTADCNCTLWNGSACAGEVRDGRKDPDDCDGDDELCTGGECFNPDPGTCRYYTSSACTVCGDDTSCLPPDIDTSVPSCNAGWHPAPAGTCSGATCYYGCFCSCAPDCTCVRN
jgi:hypothetical protein